MNKINLLQQVFCFSRKFILEMIQIDGIKFKLRITLNNLLKNKP